MQMLIDVPDNQTDFFLQLFQSMKNVKVLSDFSTPAKQQAIKDLTQAFEDVKLYEQGKKKLKTAKELLDELWGYCYRTLWAQAQATDEKAPFT